MDFQGHCPNPDCGKRYRVDESQLGRAVRCIHCGTTFTSSGPARETRGPSVPPDTERAARCSRNRAPAKLGRFQIRSRVGAGAFGTVYRGYDPTLDREVALKVPRDGALQTEGEKARFMREPKAAAQLRHPNIVPVYEAGVDGQYYFVASAFIEGRTLQETLEEHQVTFQHAARLIMELAQGIDYAHRQGIVHRDIKPANVMVDETGSPMLMDFGLAQVMGTQERLTLDGTVLGTPAYMSPEQASGKRDEVGPASDQYSLAVILYEFLCGQPPFSGPPPLVISMVINQEPPSPRSIHPHIPKDLETICLKAMNKSPQQRFADCGQLADDLRRWLEGEPVRARRLNPLERLWRWRRRNPAVAKWTAAVALLLLLVAVVATAASAWTSRALLAVDEQRGEAEEQERLKEETLERESKARTQAELASQNAVVERNKALAESERAAAERDRIERLLYATNVARAHVEWLGNNKQNSEKLLSDCPRKHRHWEWDYLNARLRNSETQTLLAHSDGIHAVMFSPDGMRIATGSSDQTIRIWDTSSAEELAALPGHSGNVVAVAFSPDGTRIASASEDQTVKIWDESSGQDLLTLSGHSDGVTSVAFRPDGKRIASAGRDGTLRVWDAATGEELRTLDGHLGPVTGVAFNADGTQLASAGEDRTIKIWNETAEKEQLTLRGHSDAVSCVAFCPDGKRIASASQDCTVRLWNVATGEEMQSLRGHSGGVSSVAFSSDGERIISGSLDNTVKVWDAVTGQVFLTLRGHSDALRAVAFSPNAKQIASASLDKSIRIWSAATD